MTYIDELDLPDLLDQLHGGVTVNEERLGVVAELQRLQPLCHRRGVVAIVTDRSHLYRQEEEKFSILFLLFISLQFFTRP